jgi:hypothetical protein
MSGISFYPISINLLAIFTYILEIVTMYLTVRQAVRSWLYNAAVINSPCISEVQLGGRSQITAT